MSIRVLTTDQYVLNLHTRIPFRYGITTLTAVPHLFVRVEAEIDGRRQVGLSSDHLPAKWFTKNPESAPKDDTLELLEVIESACTIGRAVPKSPTVFAYWKRLYDMQTAWAGGWGKAPLLAHFGTSLVERAVIDAFCKARSVPFYKALRHNTLGIDLGLLQPELAGTEPKDWLPPEPARHAIARHTIGMVDPLYDADIPAAERVEDGLPQSFESCIRAYGLKHFKIKLYGDVPKDVERVRTIARIIESNAPSDYRFTMDANENFKTVEPFREWWTKLSAEPSLQGFLQHLILVEQPLHRSVATSTEVGAAFADWSHRPPIIIDESDGAVQTAREAMDLGYAGTSHKNCKGVIKGVANACLVAKRNADAAASGRHQRLVISSEDLTNIGPISLNQDLAVACSLGVIDVERNGHHYFKGLSAFPDSIQQATLDAHPDLFRRSPQGFATLDIRDGALNVGSAIDAPFGSAIDLDPTSFTPVRQWTWESLLEGAD